MNKTWDEVCQKIKTCLLIVTGRYLNLYQKAIIVNSLVSSKLWYTSHVYPLPMMYTNLINPGIFKFIWSSEIDPIKRETLYKKKNEGGIGLLNIHTKAKSIFANTSIKIFLNSKVDSLTKFYLAIRINNIFNINEMPVNVSYINSPYYEFTIDVVKLCIHHKDFPNVNSRKIYEILMPKVKPKIENEYPRYDWNNIWRIVNFKFINVNDRPIIFKYVHEILPNNKKLYQSRLRNNPLCNFCDAEDSNIHRFYYCYRIQECLKWIRKLFFYFCGMNVNSLLKILSFDLPKVNLKVKNTLCIIISSFISCTWYNREKLESIIFILKAKIVRDQKLKLRILGDNFNKVFTENYCKSNIEFIYQL